MTSVHLTAIGNAPAHSLLKTPPEALKVNAQQPIASRGKAQGPKPLDEKVTITSVHCIPGPKTHVDTTLFEMSPELKEIAATAGVREEELMQLIDQLHGEDRSNFLSALTKSGDNARDLILTTMILDGKERGMFLDLAETLSGKGLNNFLTAVTNSPKDIGTLMETAATLSDNQLENFMSAAAMADEDISVLTDKVNVLLETSTTSGKEALSSFLSAAAKSGRYVINFMEKIQAVSKETGDNIIAHINVQPPGEDLDNFILMMDGASEDAINTIIEITPELDQQDRKSFLKTASRLDGGLEMFIDKIKTFERDHPGATPTDFSNFITTAGKAGNQIGNFLELSGRIDLGVTSKLSTVDTVNFLVAADKAGRKNLALLTELTQQFEGTDRSNLLYGAAYSQSNPGEFLSQVKEIESNKRSDFLLSAANENQDTAGPAIYMKGLLSDKAYEAFKSAAKAMDEDQLEDLVAITNELDETDRNNLFKMASAAKETTDELLNVVTLVSGTDRTAFLEVGSTLIGEELENYIKAANTAAIDAPPGTFAKFVDVTGDLSGYDRQFFLETSATAKPDMLKDFIDITKEFNTKEGLEERNPALKEKAKWTRAMRTTFLHAASKAGDNLEGIVDAAKELMFSTFKEPAAFIGVFSLAAEIATDKYQGNFIQTYA